MLNKKLCKSKTSLSHQLGLMLTCIMAYGLVFAATADTQTKAQTKAQTAPQSDTPQITMHQLTVEVEHESGKDITVAVGQAGEVEKFVFSLAQAQDAEFVASRLSDLEPPVLEAVQGALLRINRSEVLVNSKRVDEIEVEWVTETCNDTNADCESIIKRTQLESSQLSASEPSATKPSVPKPSVPKPSAQSSTAKSSY